MFHIGQLMTGKNPPDDRSHNTFSYKTLVEVLAEDNFNNNWGIESAYRSVRGSALLYRIYQDKILVTVY